MAQTEKRSLAKFLHAVDEHFWLRHGLFWLSCGGFMLWVFLYSFHLSPHWQIALRNAVLLQFSFMPPTYLLLYGVLPALWQGQSRGALVARLVAWFGLTYVLHYSFRYFALVPLNANVLGDFPDIHNVFSTGSVMCPLFIMGVAASLRVYRQWQQQDVANVALTRENYQAELQLLKTQIHPHFLFNTLNNLYALTLRQADEAPEVVARLLGLFRFVVEQGHAQSVSLHTELNLLRNYLALEKLRYGSRLRLELQVDPLPVSGRIAPLLLLPLLENAFKHGSAEQVGQAHIRIQLQVADNWFTCRITNTKNAGPAPVSSSAGIGLHNVRQRLKLLYPQRHRFVVLPAEHTFTVELALQLPVGAGPAPIRRRASRSPRPATAQPVRQ